MFRLSTVWNKYVQWNDKHPFITQAMTCGTLYGIGDFIAQKLELWQHNRLKITQQQQQQQSNNNNNNNNNNTKDVVVQFQKQQQQQQQQQQRQEKEQEHQSFDFARLARMTTFGGFIDTPILYVWYSFLDKRFTSVALGTVMKKTILDQMICAPMVYVGFFPYLGLLRGQSLTEIKETMKQDFLKTYAIDCCVWLPANFISFRFVPSRFRVAYVSFVSLCWSVALSFLGESGNHNNITATTSTTLTTITKIDGKS